MGIVFHFGDEPENMQPGEKISFGKLDFIADRFGNLRLQEPETSQQEEEQSPLVCAFAARLEEAVDAGPPAIARYLTRHAHVLVDANREHDLDVTLYIQKVEDPVPETDPTP